MNKYKTILKGVVSIINTTEKSDIGFADICTYIGENCPELAKSKDERVREAILRALRRCSAANSIAGIVLQNNGVTYNDAFAYLEKLKEQKPYEPKNRPADKDNLTQEQKPAENIQRMNLEEEIEKYTEKLYNETFGEHIGTLDEFDWEDILPVIIEYTARHFYNLRPSWKPNEEQMKHLKRTFDHSRMIGLPNQYVLESLYNDLKKL